VSLAQTGIAVNQQRVVVLRGMLRHGDGSGIGQLVGGTHHKGIEGKFIGSKAVTGPLYLCAVESLQTLIVQNDDLKLCGEDILQGGFVLKKTKIL
jgi:hypothetical protein